MAYLSVLHSLFQEPKPSLAWEGTLKASIPAPPCPQITNVYGKKELLGEEDCLYLNVFTAEVSHGSHVIDHVESKDNVLVISIINVSHINL